MNLLIAAAVGVLMASAVGISGVSAARGDVSPVSDRQLYGYASE